MFGAQERRGQANVLKAGQKAALLNMSKILRNFVTKMHLRIKFKSISCRVAKFLDPG